MAELRISGSLRNPQGKCSGRISLEYLSRTRRGKLPSQERKTSEESVRGTSPVLKGCEVLLGLPPVL